MSEYNNTSIFDSNPQEEVFLHEQDVFDHQEQDSFVCTPDSSSCFSTNQDENSENSQHPLLSSSIETIQPLNNGGLIHSLPMQAVMPPSGSSPSWLLVIGFPVDPSLVSSADFNQLRIPSTWDGKFQSTSPDSRLSTTSNNAPVSISHLMQIPCTTPLSSSTGLSYDQLGRLIGQIPNECPFQPLNTPQYNELPNQGNKKDAVSSMLEWNGSNLTKRKHDSMSVTSPPLQQRTKKLKKRHASSPVASSSSDSGHPIHERLSSQFKLEDSASVDHSDSDTSEESSSQISLNASLPEGTDIYLPYLEMGTGVIMTYRTRRGESQKLYGLLPEMTNCCGSALRFAYCSSNKGNPYRYILVYRLPHSIPDLDVSALEFQVDCPEKSEMNDQFVAEFQPTKSNSESIHTSFVQGSFSISKVGTKKVTKFRFCLCLYYQEQLIFRSSPFALVSKDKKKTHHCQNDDECFKRRIGERSPSFSDFEQDL
ncbi:hypothetical protein C9374_004975 [Naegleria lovaniensis]|uniref:Uncharacterized protein n=1 Tax=Naegleria lovaniensis TaxID=51637 RepID=A0AA88GRU6_NAELO|nr:uncharacterized protein C9374_004975 [Naegleria lovaniensis]KAG2383008.1 hypothetical protein C9374_004975 [Naegleria lovaniensis]